MHYVRYITFVCNDGYSPIDFTTFNASYMDDETWDITKRLNSAEGKRLVRCIMGYRYLRFVFDLSLLRPTWIHTIGKRLPTPP